MVEEKTLSNLTSEEVSYQDATIKNLLKLHKTFRDAVHGDIMITHLETTIMDTEEFQRL
jgi:hypothetical protein